MTTDVGPTSGSRLDFLLQLASLEGEEHGVCYQDPIDSIMMLAEQASMKSPLIRRPISPRNIPMSPMSILQSAAVSAGNYGSYFDQMLLMQGQVIDYNYGNSEDIANLSPEPMNAKRKRAMSEPYIKPQSSDGDPKKSSSMRINSSFTTDHISHSLDVGNNGSIHLLSVSELLERYKNVYNTNGRIGIYTRDERDAIIHRFQEKRARRVWRKKVRYNCRKNLADSRLRIKGRFVRAEDRVEEGEEEKEEEEEEKEQEQEQEPMETNTPKTKDTKRESRGSSRSRARAAASTASTGPKGNGNSVKFLESGHPSGSDGGSDGGSDIPSKAAQPTAAAAAAAAVAAVALMKGDGEDGPGEDFEGTHGNGRKRMRRHSIAY